MMLPENSAVLKCGVAGRKLTAIAFILLILIANLWLVGRLTGGEAPEWTVRLFFVGVAGAALGFLMMVPMWFQSRIMSGENPENCESDKSGD